MTTGIMLERRNLNNIFNKFKNHRIVVVCAPAGYGKTMAVNGWLAKDTRVKAIFSLDEYGNHLSGFCERFCSALLTCQPRNQTLDDIVSHPSFQSAPDEFTLRAVAALSARKYAVIAIDDLHLIHDSAVLQLLLQNEALEHLEEAIVVAHPYAIAKCLSPRVPLFLVCCISYKEVLSIEKMRTKNILLL